MLVLTRRSGESIVIGTDVVVTVLEVRGDQVRIGIDAPRSVQVHREEVFNQVVAENRAAVASAPKSQKLLDKRVGQLRPAGQALPSKRAGGGEAAAEDA